MKTTGELTMSTLAKRIISTRKKLKLSQAQLAKKSGVSMNAIWMYETGRTAKPQPSKLDSLAKALSVTAEWLLIGDSVKISQNEPSVVIERIDAGRPSPKEMRRIAEELLKSAEKAEQEMDSRDSLNKKLAPVRLEVLQAITNVQRIFDEQIDAIAQLEQAAARLRSLAA